MTIVSDPAELRGRLVDQLIAAGDLLDPSWVAAFRAIPRHAFLNRFTATAFDQTYDLNDPTQYQAAIAAAYTDDVLLTQLDPNGTATSASTEVGLMARMLELLDVHDGHAVLEIGTGTGYNAALLSHRLGAHLVTSIEIDPELAMTARAALHRVGYTPTVLAGDGAAGAPASAPFDRIIATCGVHRIPAAWIEQTMPGGQILANVGFSLIRLHKYEDQTATGRFEPGSAGFMRLRHHHDHVEPTVRELLAATKAGGRTRTTAVTAAILDDDAAWLVELTMPGVRPIIVHHEDGTNVHVYSDHATGSWVRATPTHDTHHADLIEHGPRQLWDEVTTLLTEWDSHGRPAPEQCGLTVRGGTHLLWLGVPDRIVRILR